MNFAELTQEALLLAQTTMLSLSKLDYKMPRDYWRCGPRLRLRGVRGRKRAVYASLPGIKMIRIRRPYSYVRHA